LEQHKSVQALEDEQRDANNAQTMPGIQAYHGVQATTTSKSSSPPDQNEAHSIIAYMKHVLDLEQVPYEDQALNDIVMVTNYDLRNWSR
jgi:hypothetical protein